MDGSLLVDVLPLFLWALLASAGGFYRVVYFVSLGYAFSITGMAVICAYRFAPVFTLPIMLQCGLLGLYGIRLGSYLMWRERLPAFRKELADYEGRATGVTLPKRFAIWLGVSLLYVLMFTPCLFNLQLLRAGGAPTSWLTWLGVAIMMGGLMLESMADRQKAAYKQQRPDRFCDVGLYKIVRCPNYLGEITFWAGGFLAGMSAYASVGTWISASVGFVCIVLIMMGSTKRLEGKQEERYGQNPEYQQYIRTVPVLFPFIPLYSLKNIKVYLE